MGSRPARNIARFPTRRHSAVFVTREALGGYLVLARSFGWLFESFSAALAQAQRLGADLGLPVRVEVGR